MKSLKTTALLLTLCAALLLFACGGQDGETPPAPMGENGEATGFFGDVLSALGELEEMTAEVKTEWDRGKNVTRQEWRLSEEAVDLYYLPLAKTDYYYYEDEEGVSADPLMAIFIDEWEEYRSLSLSSDAKAETTPELQGEIDLLVEEAESLLAATPPIHRDLVRHIVALRYRNLLLRAGVNPENTP